MNYSYQDYREFDVSSGRSGACQTRKTRRLEGEAKDFGEMLNAPVGDKSRQNVESAKGEQRNTSRHLTASDYSKLQAAGVPSKSTATNASPPAPSEIDKLIADRFGSLPYELVTSVRNATEGERELIGNIAESITGQRPDLSGEAIGVVFVKNPNVGSNADGIADTDLDGFYVNDQVFGENRHRLIFLSDAFLDDDFSDQEVPFPANDQAPDSSHLMTEGKAIFAHESTHLLQDIGAVADNGDGPSTPEDAGAAFGDDRNPWPEIAYGKTPNELGQEDMAALAEIGVLADATTSSNDDMGLLSEEQLRAVAAKPGVDIEFDGINSIRPISDDERNVLKAVANVITGSDAYDAYLDDLEVTVAFADSPTVFVDDPNPEVAGRYNIPGAVIDQPVGRENEWVMIINSDLEDNNFADSVFDNPLEGMPTAALAPDQTVSISTAQAIFQQQALGILQASGVFQRQNGA